MNAYRHLHITDRYWIENMLKAGLSFSRIARARRVHRSTIQREVKRNSCFGTYDHLTAHYRSLKKKLRGRMTFPKNPDSWSPRKFRLKRRWLSQRRYKDLRTWRFRLYEAWLRFGIPDRRRRRYEWFRSMRWRRLHRLRKYTYYRERITYPAKCSRQQRDKAGRIKKLLIPPWENSTPHLTDSPPRLKQPGPVHISFSKHPFQASEESLMGEVRPIHVITHKIPPFAYLFQLILFKKPLFRTYFSQKSPGIPADSFFFVYQ